MMRAQPPLVIYIYYIHVSYFEFSNRSTLHRGISKLAIDNIYELANVTYLCKVSITYMYCRYSKLIKVISDVGSLHHLLVWRCMCFTRKLKMAYITKDNLSSTVWGQRTDLVYQCHPVLLFSHIYSSLLSHLTPFYSFRHTIHTPP